IVCESPCLSLELIGKRFHDCASTSAKWIVLTLLPWRDSRPCTCIRQLESFETIYSAPVSKAEAHLTSPIAVEIIGNLAAKVPPNPQQTSASFISTSSRPLTLPKSSRAGRLLPSSRKP